MRLILQNIYVITFRTIKLKKIIALINITKDRVGKDSSYNLNSKKINKEFNWKSKINLDVGLYKTLKWIDNNLSNLKKEKTNYIHKK